MPLGGFAPLPIRLGVDFDSPSHARLAADLQAILKSQVLCRLTYTPGTTVVIHDYVGMNGAGPAWAPTATYNTTGDVTFTFPNTFTDSYSVEEPIAIRYAKATAHYDNGIGTSGLIHRANIKALAANSVRVFTFVSSSGVGENIKTTLTVY
jgi:hypothetical protein